MVARLRTLVIAFFSYNLVNVVFSFHCFVDLAVSINLHAEWLPRQLRGLARYERAAAAFLFLNFLLSLLACVFAAKARRLRAAAPRPARRPAAAAARRRLTRSRSASARRR